jgi:hypothetical protein
MMPNSEGAGKIQRSTLHNGVLFSIQKGILPLIEKTNALL